MTEVTEYTRAAFWAKVDKRGEDDCWPWTGANTNGYGVINKRRATHVSLMIHGKERAIGTTLVRHHCDNPACVNPKHLDWGTHEENMADMVARGRHARANNTHCIAGHELSGWNLIYDKGKFRACRQCKQDSQKRQRKMMRDALDNQPRLLAEIETTRAELAAAHALIHQLGENAAKATGEYAERVANFASALANAYQVLTYVEAVEGDADTKAACAEVRAEIDALDIKTAIRAALTEPTDG